MKPNREELERAIERITALIGWTVSKESEEAYMIALAVLRAELSRQENAPLTCIGCEREFDMCEIAICEKCIRLQNRDDRYEPKGEKE